MLYRTLQLQHGPILEYVQSAKARCIVNSLVYICISKIKYYEDVVERS